jgi:hypothetical protein
MLSSLNLVTWVVASTGDFVAEKHGEFTIEETGVR